jgi:hypothetical protein
MTDKAIVPLRRRHCELFPIPIPSIPSLEISRRLAHMPASPGDCFA